LFLWSLTPVRLARAVPRQRGENAATLAIYPLLRVFPPGDVTNVLVKQPGVRTIQLDLACGVARVAFDPRETSKARLQDFVDNCAHHCRGEGTALHSCPTDLNGR
jgi:Cu2+-exporting ATPase